MALDTEVFPWEGKLPPKYKKEFEFSYALGPFPVFEVLEAASQHLLAVFAQENFNDKEKLAALCKEKQVPLICSEKALRRISDKDVCYAAAAVRKASPPLADAPHVVLVNPSDMGNLGTIIRTILGFGIMNLAIIEPAADVFHPKVIRASMGALFRMNIESFPDFESYRARFSKRDFFPFMLDGATELTPESRPKSKQYSLIFGNEASGLPPEFQRYGQSLFIPQTKWVDSLNLAISVGIGTYLFTQSALD